MGTRGVPPSKLEDFWFKGPTWLGDESALPKQPEITETKEASVETVQQKEEKLIFEQDHHNERMEWTESLLSKYKCWRLFRITAFVLRFVGNCRRQENQSGPLTTEELKKAEEVWLKVAQRDGEMESHMELKVDKAGLWRCSGRASDYHPIFIPRKHLLATLIIERYLHEETLHGGVQATICKVRERFWIPQLRQLVKKIRFKCNRCKKLRAKPLPSSPTSALPKFRTELIDQFFSTGVDFTGPLYYKTRKKTTNKAYIALFTCATTRAVHLKLSKDLTAREFKRTLKEFIGRRGTPRQIVSDNAKTFVARKSWLEKLQKDDKVNNYLASQSIKWKFNLSRAP